MVEDDDFRSQMSGVKPLAADNRVQRRTSPARPSMTEHEKLRRQRHASELDRDASVEQAAMFSRDAVSDDYLEWVQPDDILAFKRGGVQEGVYRKFRLGKYVIDGRLDLHRLTVKEARREVAGFLSEAQAKDSRCVLILHGKGDRDPERKAVLKSYVAKWLKETDCVLAYHTAQQHHGGRGAVYVMLKKSEAMKEKTRELLGR